VAATEVIGGTAQAPGPDAPPARLEVRGPSRRDPRLAVAGVLVSVQVLGQVSIGFDLSIAQILVAMGTAGLLDVLWTARTTRVVAWPASALLTGNGVALILRVPGTEHGEWFSMRGWYVFAATAALAVLSKYVFRSGGRPLFNPSNLALVVTFLVLGSQFADPQDLWWGPMSVGLALVYALVVGAGVAITRRLGLLVISATFFAVYGGLMALLALAGHAMSARWSLGPVDGMDYWRTVVLSPEVLIFVFFMITDPRTVARGRSASVLFGASVASASAVLMAFQSTEYATKVALLTGLVVVCGARPLIERLVPAAGGLPLAGWARADGRRTAALAVGGAAVVALVLGGSLATSTERTVDPALAVELATTDLRDDQLPAVEIGSDARSPVGALDRAAAEEVVTDVVARVLLADRAVEEADPELAEAAATGEFLGQLGAREAVAAPDRTFATALLEVVRDPEDFQAVPRLAVTFVGTADGAPWSATFHVLLTGDGSFIEREVAAP